MKKIVITGGTGFVGSYLAEELVKREYEVVIVSRSKHQTKKNGVRFATYEQLEESINSSYAVINLAGHNLFDERWSDEVKGKILSSRIDITRKIVESIKGATEKPEVFVSASAVGYYGNRGAEFLREDSFPGNDFLSDVCKKWEEEAQKAEIKRIVIPRIGIVLEKDGGALGKMLTPFKLFVGGPLGSGNQYFPWVHMKDVVFSILESIENENYSGVYNCVAPQQVTMSQFSSALGTVLNRPSLFAVPEFALKLVFGEATGALIASQRVVPEELFKLDFRFQYDELTTALKSIV
jgi:uncharacterized protein (TIGR01777 family)